LRHEQVSAAKLRAQAKRSLERAAKVAESVEQRLFVSRVAALLLSAAARGA
jgi:hypothetical protein